MERWREKREGDTKLSRCILDYSCKQKADSIEGAKVEKSCLEM